MLGITVPILCQNPTLSIDLSYLWAKSRFPDLLETLVVRRKGWSGWSRGLCAQGRRATRLRYAPTWSALLILKHFPTLLLLRSLTFSSTVPNTLIGPPLYQNPAPFRWLAVHSLQIAFGRGWPCKLRILELKNKTSRVKRFVGSVHYVAIEEACGDPRARSKWAMLTRFWSSWPNLCRGTQFLTRCPLSRWRRRPATLTRCHLRGRTRRYLYQNTYGNLVCLGHYLLL